MRDLFSLTGDRAFGELRVTDEADQAILNMKDKGQLKAFVRMYQMENNVNLNVSPETPSNIDYEKKV